MDDADINRFKWTRDKVKAIRKDVRGGRPTQWGLDGNKVMYHDKQLISEEKIPKLLTKLVKDGAPISIEGLYRVVWKHFWGVSRRAISKWLRTQNSYQMLHKRPSANSRRNKSKREGTTNWLSKYPNALGVDLFAIPDSWSKNSHLLVCVHRRSRFTWVRVLQRPTASLARTKFRAIVNDCTQHLGVPGMVLCDGGSEFKGVFEEYLNKQGIRKKVIKLVSFVENKNSTLGRYISYMLHENYKWKHALSKSIEKLNNIRSRITKQRPIDVYNGNVEHYTESRRKLKEVPQSRKLKPHPVNSKVRVLQRKALRKNDKFYKSYRGYRVSNWSEIDTITKKRKDGNSFKYKIGDGWFPHENIQVV